MEEPTRFFASLGDLIRDICFQLLARPLDITQAIDKLNSKLDDIHTTRIIQVGSISHASYLASVLKAVGRDVTIIQDPTLYCMLMGAHP